MTTKFFGRIALALGTVLLVSLFAWEACSDELNIIQVHRNIPLSDDEPVIKDIYLSGGTDSGLRTNLVVHVFRKVIVKDATGSQSFGEMQVPVGQLKIIFVSPKIAVAREYKNANYDSTPALDQMGVQIGDKIELKGSFVDNRKSTPTTAIAATSAATTGKSATPVTAPTASTPTTADASQAQREPSAENTIKAQNATPLTTKQ